VVKNHHFPNDKGEKGKIPPIRVEFVVGETAKIAYVDQSHSY